MQREQLEAWAREAGAVALEIYRDIERAQRRRKPDRSWVTAADEQVEALLRRRIGAAYPQQRIMGEEEGGTGSASEDLWALDPVDGTDAFIAGIPAWGVSIGFLRAGVPVAGCFYMPASDDCYSVGLDGPAMLNGQPISVGEEQPDHESWVAVPSNSHRRYHISFAGKTRALGSTAAHICYVARGVAAGALLGHAAIWDIAGAQAILRRCGGDIWQLSGAPLQMEPLLAGRPAAEPLLATTPGRIRRLCEQIRVR